MRLGKEELNYLKQKYSVDRIWSYSRLNTYVSQPWVYRMTYLEKEKVRTENIYSVLGGKVHDVVQDFQEGKTNREEMSDAYEKVIMDWRMSSEGYQFLNEKVERAYINNLADYFKNTEKIPYEVKNEKPVLINFKDEIGDIVFIGYIDTLYKDDNDAYHILDYKSSSKGEFTGKKLKEHSEQLQLYAIGIHQLYDIPYEKIHIEFDMMKYYKVSYHQKNGKWKDSIQERASWVMSQEKKIRTILLENDYTVFEIDEMVGNANADNTIEDLPQCVKEKFKLKNCYIEAEIDEEIALEVEKKAVKNVRECLEKESGDLDNEFPEPIIDESNRFYFEQLAPQMLKYHKGYQEEKATAKSRVNDMSMETLDALFS